MFEFVNVMTEYDTAMLERLMNNLLLLLFKDASNKWDVCRSQDWKKYESGWYY